MEYTVDDLKIISWPEPVRVRPSLYMKELGTTGCVSIIKELLDTILSEEYWCNADNVELRFTRFKEIIIEYDGYGMPITCSNADGITQPLIYDIFMRLSAGHFREEDYKKFGHLCEIGPIFNAVCKELQVSSIWDDKVYSLAFYKGCLSRVLSESNQVKPVNCLRFKFDEDVMGKIELGKEELEELTEDTLKKYKDKNIHFS